MFLFDVICNFEALNLLKNFVFDTKSGAGQYVSPRYEILNVFFFSNPSLSNAVRPVYVRRLGINFFKENATQSASQQPSVETWNRVCQTLMIGQIDLGLDG